MKLSGRNEWIVIGALIVYIAFFPPFEPIRQALRTSVGKAVMLAAIVYTWKYWSPIVAVLLAINYLRCAASGNIWEMFSGAENQCTCKGNGFSFDPFVKKCLKGKEEGDIEACNCASGYAWDVSKKECVVNSGTQPPVAAPSTLPMPSATAGGGPAKSASSSVFSSDQPDPSIKPPPPPASESKTTSSAAPASSTSPETSTAPATTPGAAQAVINSTPAAEFFRTGPLPSEPFSTQYSSF